MRDDLLKWFGLEIKETFSLMRDWRLYAAMGIVLAGAFGVGLMGDNELSLLELALMVGVGMVIGVSLRWLRRMERREKSDSGQGEE